MPKKFMRVYEAFGIQDAVGAISKKIKDQLSNMVLDTAHSNDKVSVLSEIAVTHAGIVNGNYGYYTPEGLQRSAETWVRPYKKPLLANHNKRDGEPLGRIEGSIYQRMTPAQIPDVKTSVYDSDFKYRGLGYLQNLVKVSDPTAVQKVLDGRYLTVSVSGDTDMMECSICGKNWLSDGQCHHRFGHEYDEDETGEAKLAYWTGGDFIWDELSFVNEPADPFAQIVTREINEETQSQVLQVYNYKDATVREKAVEDCNASRLFRLYALNDSLGTTVKLNDSTSVDSLYKIYGKRIHAIGSTAVKPDLNNNVVVEDSTRKEPITLADNTEIKADAQTPAAETPKAETPVADTQAVVAAETTTPEEVKSEAAPAEPAVTETQDSKPVPAPEAEVVVEPKAEEVVPPVADTKTPEPDPKIKTLEARVKELEDEHKALLEKATSLQATLKDSKINRVLDLKSELGLETYPSADDRKKAFDEMQKRSADSLEDQLKDLEAAATKNAKRITPKDLKVEGEGGELVADPVKQLHGAIDSANPLSIAKLMLSGKFNPPTR
jgi:hypothetical protein